MARCASGSYGGSSRRTRASWRCPAAISACRRTRTRRTRRAASCGTRRGWTAGSIEQLQTFSGRGRDPRGWSISIVYYALVAEQDLAGAELGLVIVPVDALPLLPFDHADVVRAAIERLRDKSTYSSLPAYLLPPEFTMSELQCVYEQVLGTQLDRASFRRKIQDQRIIEPATGAAARIAPAQLYRLGGETLPVLADDLMSVDAARGRCVSGWSTLPTSHRSERAE